MLWWPKYWSKGHQTLAQFLFYSDNWYSKCFEPKGCPKKNLKYVFWSRGQKSKFQTWSNCAEILHGLVGYQYKLFVFSGPYWFRPILKKTAILKKKMAIFWKLSLNKKIVTVQKRSEMCFYIILGGQKKLFNFSQKNFWDTLQKKKIS